jgi:hypothetical protein
MASIAAFEVVRAALADIALLDHPAANAQLSLVVDALATVLEPLFSSSGEVKVGGG